MRLPADAVILAIDETILRLFPPLRAAWARQAEQAHVPLSGRNDRRVLYGAINIRTGHRIIEIRRSMKAPEFHAFLEHLRRCYRGRTLCLLIDKHGSHQAPATLRLAARLGIRLLWLPTQSPELNAMDHLWRELKQRIAANRQYESIEAEASTARDWTLALSRGAALRLAGLKSTNNWLRRVSQYFCGPT
jgi:transposase